MQVSDGEKCQVNVPTAPGFVLITVIMFILFQFTPYMFSFHFFPPLAFTKVNSRPGFRRRIINQVSIYSRGIVFCAVCPVNAIEKIIAC